MGDFVNSWDAPVNSDWSIIDRASGDQVTYPVTGGTLNLTAAQAVYLRIIFTGVLTGDETVVVPAGLGGRRYFLNLTTGGFNVIVKNGVGDVRGGVILPYGFYCPVLFIQGAALYDNYQSVPPGTIHSFAGLTAPAGFFLCNGASLVVATYPDLFNVIGYAYGGAGANFNIPDTRGRVLAGADNMGGAAAGRLTGYTATTVGGEQTHVLITAELAAHNHGVTDTGHVHAITDAGHTHGPASNLFIVGTAAVGGTAGGGFAPTPTTTAAATANATTGISINNNTTGVTTNNNGSGTAHNNIQPTMAINHIIRF